MRLVTKPAATDLLKRNTHNRKIAKSVVEKYCLDHSAGEWIPNAAGVGFDVNGVLLDGQHRLKMIEESGKPAWLLIVTGLPPKAQETHDRQRKRTLYDVCHLAGMAAVRADVNVATSICKFASGQYGWSPSDGQVKAALENHKESITFLREESGVYGKKGLGRAAICASFVMALELNKEKAIDFIRRFVSGENMTNNFPPMRLRKWVMEDNHSSQGTTAQIEDYEKTNFAIKSWFDGKMIDRLYRIESLS
jgi:hypothetical protein